MDIKAIIAVLVLLAFAFGGYKAYKYRTKSVAVQNPELDENGVPLGTYGGQKPKP